MSISTSIDGSLGGINALDLLATVVSNPTVYEAKLKALQEATAENKKYVELVGPASDILRMQTDIRAEKELVAAEVDKAKADAKSILANAKDEANKIIGDASDQAADILAGAKAAEFEAKSKLAEVNSKISAAESAKANAEKAAQASADQSKKLAEATDAANAEAESYAAKKAEIIAKHKAFIESL